MTPIVCIVGKSGSGKTRLMSRLIPEMKRRGYRIATIKHTHHHVETDVIGKDTWLHARAGSECIVLASPEGITVMHSPNGDLTPDEVSRFIPGDFDLILVEGFKETSLPKIEVHRQCAGSMVCQPQELLAIVTDNIRPDAIPQYEPDDTYAVADLIETEILNRHKSVEVTLFADGNQIPLNSFVQGFINGSISGMIDSLKGIDHPKHIRIEITRLESPPVLTEERAEEPEYEMLRTFL